MTERGSKSEHMKITVKTATGKCVEIVDEKGQ